MPSTKKVPNIAISSLRSRSESAANFSARPCFWPSFSSSLIDVPWPLRAVAGHVNLKLDAVVALVGHLLFAGIAQAFGPLQLRGDLVHRLRRIGHAYHLNELAVGVDINAVQAKLFHIGRALGHQTEQLVGALKRHKPALRSGSAAQSGANRRWRGQRLAKERL